MSRNHDQSLLRASTDARAQLAIDDYAYRVNQEIDHLALSLSLGNAANLGNAWRITTRTTRGRQTPGHADERAGAAPAGRELRHPPDTSDNLAHFITMCASFRPTTCHYTLNEGL